MRDHASSLRVRLAGMIDRYPSAPSRRSQCPSPLRCSPWPAYTDDSKERVRDAVDVVDLVGTRVELRHAHDALRGAVPLLRRAHAVVRHQSGEKLFHCFGCRELGVRAQFRTGALRGDETLEARATVTVPGLSQDVVVTATVALS